MYLSFIAHLPQINATLYHALASTFEEGTNFLAVLGLPDFPFAVLGLDGFFSVAGGGRPGVYVRYALERSRSND